MAPRVFCPEGQHVYGKRGRAMWEIFFIKERSGTALAGGAICSEAGKTASAERVISANSSR